MVTWPSSAHDTSSVRRVPHYGQLVHVGVANELFNGVVCLHLLHLLWQIKTGAIHIGPAIERFLAQLDQGVIEEITDFWLTSKRIVWLQLSQVKLAICLLSLCCGSLLSHFGKWVASRLFVLG